MWLLEITFTIYYRTAKKTKVHILDFQNYLLAQSFLFLYLVGMRILVAPSGPLVVETWAICPEELFPSIHRQLTNTL